MQTRALAFLGFMDRLVGLLVFLLLLAVALPKVAATAQEAVPALVLALVALVLRSLA
jgi:hypothetical protein